MRKLSLFPAVVLLCVINLLVQPSIAQTNTVLTSVTSLPGGGTGFNSVVIGPDNTYPDANGATQNVFIGKNAGRGITNGSYNAFTGINAGYSNTTGSSNTFTGDAAGYSNTTGENNTFTGGNAGNRNTAGARNSFFGQQAGNFNTTGNSNLFSGYQAGYSNTTGNFNTYTGIWAGYSNTTGYGNTFTGPLTGYGNTTGVYNSFMGSDAGKKNTTGSYNSFTGNSSGDNNTTGTHNSFTGAFSGRKNTTGNGNTFLGNESSSIGPNETNLQRATALGNKALVGVDYGLVLGDTTNVKVGIGTAYPNQRFTLRGNMNFVAYDNSLMLKERPFLHFNEHESLALGLGAEIPAGAEKTLVLGSDETSVQIPGILSTYQPNAGQFLTVNPSGKIVLSQPRVQVASVADWSDRVFEDSYPLRPLEEVEAFVKKNKHLPGVPSAEAMVAEGMESAAFNAKLLEKIEELTLYVVALEKRLKELEKK